jgi:MutL protein
MSTSERTSVSTELALLVDVGSAWVKAGVVGRARGRWRVVAHASQPTAWGAAELRGRLVEQLEASGDPRLSGHYEQLMSSANRIECHTARQTGRVAVVAVSRELSGGAARRAAEAAGWEVAELVTLDDGRSLAERLALLQATEVDAWLLTGGFDDAASPRALEAAGLVAAARPVDGGPVVWAGSARLADAVAALFEPDAVTVVANPRPGPHREHGVGLREHLQGLLRDTVAQEDQAHLAATTLPRAVSVVAASGGLRVLAVDLGARGAIRALAEPDGSVASRLHSAGGLAGIGKVPGAAGRVARIAGDAGDEAAVADLVQTMRARPASLPQSDEELAGLHAAARVLVAAMFDDDPAGPVDLLVGAGRTIAGAPRPSQAARILLDGARPVGITQLATDPSSILGPLGSLPDGELGEALELLGDDALAPLGTAVVTRGGVPGGLAMRVTVHRAGWPTPAPIDVRVGQVHVVGLGPGQEAELGIELGPGVSLGASRRSPRIAARAMGGAVGLILDARGMPIALPRRSDDRRTVLAGWRDALAREGEASA